MNDDGIVSYDPATACYTSQRGEVVPLERLDEYARAALLRAVERVAAAATHQPTDKGGA